MAYVLENPINDSSNTTKFDADAQGYQPITIPSIIY